MRPGLDATDPSWSLRLDGSTDDGPALGALIEVARSRVVRSETPVAGQVVELPGKSVLVTNRQIVIPPYVRLRGRGWRSTVIKAGPDFPRGTPVVRIAGGGTSKDLPFFSGLVDLAVDCSHVPGSTGVYSSDLQEQCGVRGVVVVAFRSDGSEPAPDGTVEVEQGGVGFRVDNADGLVPANWSIEDSQFRGSGAGCTYGIYLGAPSSGIHIRRVTCTARAGGKGEPGIAAVFVGPKQRGSVGIDTLHVENYTDGVQFRGFGVLFVKNLSGQSADPSVVNDLHILTDGSGSGTSGFGAVTAFAIAPNRASGNIVLDEVRGITLSAAANQPLSEYVAARFHPSGDSSVRHGGGNVAWQHFEEPTQFANGMATFSKAGSSVSDADFVTTPPDGTMAVTFDGATWRLWIRGDGVWRSAVFS